MKKYFLAMAFCAYGSNYCMAQLNATVRFDYTIHYDYTFRPSKEDTTRQVTEPMLLQTGKSFSSFQSLNRYLKDSIIRAEAIKAEASGIIPNMSTLDMPERPKINYIVFKDFSLKQMSYTNRFGIQQPFYRDTLPAFELRFSEEEKTILGYPCKKAGFSFAGRQYIAWYTTAIPVADGPYKFNGFPGLALEIHDLQQQHRFTATRVSLQPSTVQLKNWQGRFVQAFANKAGFDEYVKILKNDPERMFSNDLIHIPDDKVQDISKKIKEDIRRNNNTLELE